MLSASGLLSKIVLSSTLAISFAVHSSHAFSVGIGQVSRTTRTFAKLATISMSTTSVTATDSTCGTTTATTTPKKLEDISESYKTLKTKLETITQLSRCQSILSYDQMVFMPKNAQSAGERGAQLSALSGVIHEMKTNTELLTLMEQSETDLAATASPETYTDESRLLTIEKKAFLENARVPTSLASKAASLSSRANRAWEESRANDDFASFAPLLKECFDTAKETAAAKRGEESKKGLYDQMLDEFEIGMGRERIDDVFSTIREALVPLIAKVLASESVPSVDCLTGNFPVKKQEEFSNRIVRAIGYDDKKGRIDVSTHPFTSASSTADVRITSRFTEGSWTEGLYGTIHEGGHALYEQNLNPAASSLESALSMGAHESQSLFWERHVGLTRSFWKYAAPLMAETFEGFEKYGAEEIYKAVNKVTPSLIRVEADELTYPLHVILRYEIETDVIDGKLDVKDVPKRWNEDMKRFLDVDVPSDKEGCLQDIHWSVMAIAYFPTYLIGSATAAQLDHYIRKDIPEFDELIEKGEFTKIREWLTDKIHRHGKRYESLDQMLEAQLGEKLNPKYFIDYLTKKYSDIYEL